jgi:hypothetical protein
MHLKRVAEPRPIVSHRILLISLWIYRYLHVFIVKVERDRGPVNGGDVGLPPEQHIRLQTVARSD